MYGRLLVWSGCHQCDAILGENIRIEAPPHRKARAEQDRLPEPKILRHLVRRFHDAEESNRYTNRNLVEYDVRSICGNQGKISAGVRQHIHGIDEILRKPGQVIRADQAESFIDIDTIDDEMRIAIFAGLPLV